MTGPRHSVRLRLTIWNVVVLALTLAALGASLRIALERTLLAGVDRQLLDRTRPMRPPPPGLEGGPPPFFRPDRPFRPRLLDADGHDLRSGEARPLDDPAAFRAAWAGQPSFSTVSRPEGRLRVYTAPFEDRGQIIGVAQEAAPLGPVDEQIARLTGVLLMLIPLALLLSAAGALLLTDRALRPVRQIQNAAALMSASDLSRRLPVMGNDEFADLARTINGLLGRLETAFEEQRRFTADASHELRTPLTVIKAHTSLALGSPDLPPAVRPTFEAVDAAADRTNRLVLDLLLLARGDAGQARAQRTPLRLEGVLEQAAANVRRPGAAPITVSVPDALPWVLGDESALVRVFENLLSNAVRHTPAGGLITVTARADGGWVTAAVTDTGEGIPEEHLPRLGERFYRVDAARSRRQGGSGLGLAICRSLLAAHGGRLHLASAIGRGTTAEVRLPLLSASGRPQA